MQCKKCGSEWKTSARASLIIKCPFCGAEIIEAAVTLEGYTNVLVIHCSRCGTDFELHEQDRDTYTTIDGDIYQIVSGSPLDLWNTRASDGKGGK